MTLRNIPEVRRKGAAMLLAAALSVCGCVNKVGDYGSDSRKEPVYFNVPVVSPTRTAPGAANTEIGQNYDTREHFSVYAIDQDRPFADLTPALLERYFMQNLECAYNSSVNGWTPLVQYFWPPFSDGAFYLSFQAYSPSVAEEDMTILGHDWTNGFTFSGFSPRAAGQQYDLLFTDIHKDKQRAHYSPEPGYPYDDSSPNPYMGIDLNFRHALTSIAFKIRANVDENALQTVRLQSIRIVQAWDKATFAQNIGGTPSWTPDVDASETSYYAYRNTGAVTDGVQLTATDFCIPNAMLLIPQALDHTSTGHHVRIEVSYSRTTGGSTTVSTDTIDLVTGNGDNYYQYIDEDNNLVDIDSWKIGYRYTYRFTINLFKIFVDPSVDPWSDYGGIDMDI